MTRHIESFYELAEGILLSDNDELDVREFQKEYNYSFEHAHYLLKSKSEYDELYKYELKLRLALHFSPIDAIKFDISQSKSREELIEEYIVTNFKKDKIHAQRLSIVINQILKNWNKNRESIIQYREELLKEQNYKCNHCGVKLDIVNSKYETVFINDKYKPYSKSNGYNYLYPEVDHIKPVSSIGDNSKTNLQVLCRLCNRAKSNILNIKVLDEVKYAGEKIEEIKTSHIHRMLYFTIERAKKQCENCLSKDTELSIRKRFKDGSFTRSNLIAVCKTCADLIDHPPK